jgi:hypothetical protein
VSPTAVRGDPLLPHLRHQRHAGALAGGAGRDSLIEGVTGLARHAEGAALGYKNLLEAERGFRDLKSILLPRPVFHRLEHRIRAHVLICWLALLLTRVAERSSGQTWRNINRQLGRISQVTLAGPAGTVVQTTPPTAEQKAIYQALSVQQPARVTTFDPA